MRQFSFSAICLVLALASSARGSIVSWTCSGGSGGISAQETNWWQSQDGTYGVTTIASSQTSPDSGSISTTTVTNNTTDPTIKYNTSIINDTGATWSGYQFQVKLDTQDLLPSGSYSLSAGVISLPADWTIASMMPLAYVGDVGGQHEYVGGYTLQGGAAIADGGELDFSYILSFQGSTHYAATQVQTPILAAIPEPGSAALIAGLLLGMWSLRRKLIS